MKQFFILGMMMISLSSFAQDYWEGIDRNISRSDSDVIIESSEFSLFTLDINDIRKELLEAPNESSITRSTKTIFLPTKEGLIEEFQVVESSIMEKGLQEKYPSIRTYRGQNNEGSIVRLDINSNSFHAAIYKDGKTTYVDPYLSDNTLYAAYKDESIQNIGDINCGTEHDDLIIRKQETTELRNNKSDVALRTYRYAVACTGEFGKRAGSKEAALETITTHTNRINLIFEQELAIKLLLVDGLEKVLYTDPVNDPFQNTSDGGAMVDGSTKIINDSLGVEKYDIGHVYNTTCNVGGIAYVGSVCYPDYKGGGITCASNQNVNYFVLVTAHELGHQFSALHTMNKCRGNNESPGNGVEIGSGTTIMSYAGLCGINNVQNEPDGYFHSHSLGQIYSFSRDPLYGGECSTIDPSRSLPEPSVTEMPQEGLYIPTETPFVLEGAGTTNSDNDTNIRFSWEQVNTGPSSTIGKPIGDAPRFRSFAPTENPNRIIPAAEYTLIGSQPRLEKLSKKNQTLKFNFTVRDSKDGLGTAVWNKLNIHTVAYGNGEKFEITTFNNSDESNTITPGQKVELTWNVSNTLDDKMKTDYLDLYWFVGSSEEFDFTNMKLIGSKISNNGYYAFNAPVELVKKGRFVLRGHNNIFFDVNDSNIKINEPETKNIVTQATPSFARICTSETSSVDVNLQTIGFGGLTGNVSFEVSDLPEGISASFKENTIAIGESNVITFKFENVTDSGTIPVEIKANAESGETFTQIVTFDVSNQKNDFVITPIYPNDKSIDIEVAPTFKWNTDKSYSNYYIQVSTKNTFSENFEMAGTGSSSLELSQKLTNSTEYFWRIKGNNNCGTTSYSPTYSFTVANKTSTNEDLLKDMEIFPNPAKNIVNISNNTEFRTGTISDINGRDLINFKITGSNKSVDIQSLSNGVYLLTLKGKNLTATQKIVVTR